MRGVVRSSYSNTANLTVPAAGKRASPSFTLVIATFARLTRETRAQP